MPEVSRFDTLQTANLGERMAAQRKSSNMSTSSEDSLRKISNDSGIGIGASGRAPNQYDDLLGEPRLPTDLSAAMLQLAHQQSLSAAALNPMLGLMSAGLGGLWANPLATAMLQQEATARKLLESGGAQSKQPTTGSGPTKPYSKDSLSMYPGFAGLVQPSSQVPDQLALSEALRGQLLNRKLSEEMNGVGVSMKPTRKANSFSGTSSSPLHRQFSPPSSNIASPNLLNNSPSPNNRNVTSHSGDEQQPSPYGDEDSVCSGKSSNRSRTPQPSGTLLDNQPSISSSYTLPTTEAALQHGSILNSNQFHPSSRKRKNGIIGSMPMTDLSAYSPLGHSPFAAQPSTTNDIPMHKLSTASLPASLPSAAPHRTSLVQDPLSNRGSPATSRKRQRNIQADEKVGSRREDESYWERRRKNNEAAKRSRDSRRAKEDEIAIRAAFLEQENFKMRIELNKMKEERSQLQTELDAYKKASEEKRKAVVEDNSTKSRDVTEASIVDSKSPGSASSDSTTTNNSNSSSCTL